MGEPMSWDNVTTDGLGSVFANKPVAEVHDHSGKEAGLRNTKQEPGSIELHWSVHERRQCSEETPGNHGSRDGLARAPTFDQQRARDLQRQISDEEDADPEAEHAIAEAKIARHSNGRIGNAGAIQKVGDVQDKQEGQQPPRSLMTGAIYVLGIREVACSQSAANHSGASSAGHAPRGVYQTNAACCRFTW
jgi:hypothetical protein